MLIVCESNFQFFAGNLVFLGNFLQVFQSGYDYLLEFVKFLVALFVRCLTATAHQFLMCRAAYCVPCLVIGYQSLAGDMIPENGIRIIEPMQVIYNHARIVNAHHIINHLVNCSNERLPVFLNASRPVSLPSKFIIQACSQKSSGEYGEEKFNEFWQTCCESFPQDLSDIIHYALVMLVVGAASFLAAFYGNKKTGRH